MNIDTQYMEDTEMMSTIPAGYEHQGRPHIDDIDPGMVMLARGLVALFVVIAVISFGAAIWP